MNEVDAFISALKDAGWVEQRPIVYRKGSWEIFFDTSSWMEIGTEETPRIFDVAVPDARLTKWTINLIEHLCATDDEVWRLKHLLTPGT